MTDATYGMGKKHTLGLVDPPRDAAGYPTILIGAGNRVSERLNLISTTPIVCIPLASRPSSYYLISHPVCCGHFSVPFLPLSRACTLIRDASR